MSENAESQKDLRVMLVDDDQFALAILGETISAWAEVLCVASVAEAIANLEEYDPHVVVSDLNFNGGPDGSELLGYLAKELPWIGRVVLSSHASGTIATGSMVDMPPDTIYLIKSDIAGSSQLREAIVASISGRGVGHVFRRDEAVERIHVTRSQAVVLKLIAEGKSNSSIAAELGITQRSAESMVQRVMHSLNLHADSATNPRVLATRMWIEGRVTST